MPGQPRPAFAALLVQLRTSARLTQEDLANASGVAVRTISDLERGRALRPRSDTVLRLADALQLSGRTRAEFEAAAREHAMIGGPRPASSGRQSAAIQTLPRDIADSFTARAAELDLLVAAAVTAAADGRRVPVYVIRGMAGVGKTSLAVHAAHQISAYFPDGQLFIDLHGFTEGIEPLTALEALGSLLRSLGVPPSAIPETQDERAAGYRSRLAGTRTLIVLDNAASSAQVRPLLPGTGGCLVIITSRESLTGVDDLQPVPLAALTQPEAITLFRAIAGRERVTQDDPSVPGIVELCGHLPLAIRIIAARLGDAGATSMSAKAVLRQLSRARGSLAHMRDADRSLVGAFESSYRSLATDEQDMFRSLGLVPGPDFDAYAAASLSDVDVGTAEWRLDSLLRHNLLIQRTTGRYSFHDLIRVYARTLIAKAGEPDDPAGTRHRAEHDAALGRLFDYYLHTARAADRHLARRALPAAPGDNAPSYAPTVSTRQQAIDWMEAEHLNLHAAATAALHDRPAYAVAIPAAMNAFLCIQGHWDQARNLGYTALDAARRTSDRRGQAIALANLAIVQRLTAQFPAALASNQGALNLYHDIDDQAGQADTLSHLGRLQYLTDDLAAATGSLSRALELYRALGDRAGEADALTHLGYVRYVIGEFPGAAGHLSRALELCRALGDPAGEVDALSYLGILQYETGQYPQAKVSFTRMLRLCRAIGDRNGEAWALNYLGYLQTLTGLPAEAIVNLARALEIFGNLGNGFGEATALNSLGVAQRLAEDYQAAAVSQERSLELYRGHRSQLGEANTLKEIGILQHLAGDAPAASASEAKALALYRVLKDRLGEAQARNNIGDLLLSSRPAEAQDSYDQALFISREITSPLEEARALEGIGRCHLRNGRPGPAADSLRQALTIYQRLGSPDSRRVMIALEADAKVRSWQSH